MTDERLRGTIIRLNEVLRQRGRYRLRIGVILAAVLWMGSAGTPHLLVTYDCSFNRCSRQLANSCNYIGVFGYRRGVSPDPRHGCSPISLM